MGRLNGLTTSLFARAAVPIFSALVLASCVGDAGWSSGSIGDGLEDGDPGGLGALEIVMDLREGTYWHYVVEVWSDWSETIDTALVEITLGVPWNASFVEFGVPVIMLYPTSCRVVMAEPDIGVDWCGLFRWVRDLDEEADYFLGLYDGDLVSYRSGDPWVWTLMSGARADDLDFVYFDFGSIRENRFGRLYSAFRTEGWVYDDPFFGGLMSPSFPDYHLAFGFGSAGGLMLYDYERKEPSCDRMLVGGEYLTLPTSGFVRHRVEGFDAMLGMVVSARSDRTIRSRDRKTCNWREDHAQWVVRLIETSLGPTEYAVPGPGSQR